MSPLLSLLLLLPAADEPVKADVVIRGATLIDGTGRKGAAGDLAIKGERIVAVGSFQVAGKPRVIDGKGLVVAPGLIDLHTHSDTALTRKATRANRNYLMQGVTTVVTGNCGFGPDIMADFLKSKEGAFKADETPAYFKALERGGVGTNVLHLVPHNSVRKRVMGNVNRAPTAAELKKMQAVVEQGMKAGAFGMSTGLIYDPGSYSETDELIALAKVVAKHGGIYASHIRDEGVNVVTATEEAIKIGREAKVPVHISHMKATGKKAWGKSADSIAVILQARKKGLAVTADQYPYTASSTSLTATLVPPRFREGTRKEYEARLADKETGPRIRKAIEGSLKERGGEAIRVASYAKNRAWQGKDLEAIARAEKKKVIDVVMEIERNGGASIVNFGMSEEDVRAIMKQPFVATASDGSARVPDKTVPHPRNYGCFPRKIGKYAIADKVVTLEHAVRSSSGLPADILRLPERGYLKAGYYADVVVFDPKTFRDTATYEKPHQYAAGVRWLFVNGKEVVKEGKYAEALAGKVLRHRAPKGEKE
jgi:N-acyl-D-amino-acid deacylase